jgi:hypothetical protein
LLTQRPKPSNATPTAGAANGQQKEVWRRADQDDLYFIPIRLAEAK